ncbi:hypothetical protein ACJRO7_029854 [Eucalyptus globulus]|uniref:Uncharacterized protein n=1 Tax=Eucalyptus globulus TaxID=34317 RepID=A0ABD3J9U1_EUCGL
MSDRMRDVLKGDKACEGHIGQTEEYQKYVKIMEAPVDIVDFLNSLLTAKDSLQDPTVTGPSDTPVYIILTSVMLIISDPKISEDDIETLKIIHDDPNRIRRSPKEDDWKEILYELVWIPIVDATPKNFEALHNLKSLMQWAYRYIKEEWRFKREAIIVALDSLGNESTDPWKDPCNWVKLVIKETVVPHKTLDEITTEYILFYGGTAAITADVTGVPNIDGINLKVKRLQLTKIRR